VLVTKQPTAAPSHSFPSGSGTGVKRMFQAVLIKEKNTSSPSHFPSGSKFKCYSLRISYFEYCMGSLRCQKEKNALNDRNVRHSQFDNDRVTHVTTRTLQNAEKSRSRHSVKCKERPGTTSTLQSPSPRHLANDLVVSGHSLTS
jgi:hypothetical protein